jgi:hypothetical protein
MALSSGCSLLTAPLMKHGAGAFEGPSTGYKDGGRVQADSPPQQVRRQPRPSHPDFGIARAFRRVTRAFLDEYLVSETGSVPFGGRDSELKCLDDWLSDPKAAPRMLVTAPAGRGKSALLVQWMKSLQDRGQIGEDGWQLVFMPISIRIGTNRPGVFLAGLVQRLAEVTDKPIAREAIQDADALKYVVQDQLEAIASSVEKTVVVLDGLDEALQGSFDPLIIPARLPPTLRVLLSARWQVGDVDSAGWLRRLSWDRNVRVENFELERLSSDGIVDVLLKLGAPTDVLSQEKPIIARLVDHCAERKQSLLIERRADQLQAERQALGVEPGRHRDAGRPFMFTVTVNTSLRYISIGSALFSPIANAAEGVDGVDAERSLRTGDRC